MVLGHSALAFLISISTTHETRALPPKGSSGIVSTSSPPLLPTLKPYRSVGIVKEIVISYIEHILLYKIKM